MRSSGSSFNTVTTETIINNNLQNHSLLGYIEIKINFLSTFAAAAFLLI